MVLKFKQFVFSTEMRLEDINGTTHSVVCDQIAPLSVGLNK